MKLNIKRVLLSFGAIVVAMGGYAQKHSYQLNVGIFDKLNVCDNVHVEYRCVPDSAGYIAFEGEEEFADAFYFTNSKGKLKIQVNTEDVNNPNLPVLRVYSHSLVEVENSSIFTTYIKSKINTPMLVLRQVGNGRIEVKDVVANEVSATLATGKGEIVVSGKCDVANLKMVGAGEIKAENLDAKKVKCQILGSGDIYCDAEERLESRGIGSTSIYYKGNPEIKKVGGGKIIPIDKK